MTPIDQNLFQRASQGDRDAFWRLAGAYRGLIYSVALGMLRDHERAEDALHDVLLLAFQNLPNLRDAAKLPGWLYSLTRNHIMDAMRREERLRRSALGAARLAEVVPVAELIKKEGDLKRLEQALNLLPEPFRVILGLKYMNDYSCREIGEILGIDVATVKSRLFEARKLLRKKTESLETVEQKENRHEVL